MIFFANAKINLGLNVVRRRADGYHDLETCFYPIGLYAGLGDVPEQYDCCLDIIEITEAENDTFRRYGQVADCNHNDDLTYRALSLFREECKEATKSKPVAINLYKRLPFGAGLGGGSADAGCTLRLLNEFFHTDLHENDLAAMAVSLGADCPFFIYNRPMSASGIGDVLKPLPEILKGYWGAIVQPPYTISTRDAFGKIKPAYPEKSPEEIVKNITPGEWRYTLVNDFEQSMFTLHPEARDIKKNMYAAGAVYASMSGSGSAFYAIFAEKQDALRYICQCNLPWKSVIRF